MAMHVPAAGFATMLKEGAKVLLIIRSYAAYSVYLAALPRNGGGGI